jgi:hypothetical protein
VSINSQSKKYVEQARTTTMRSEKLIILKGRGRGAKYILKK